MITNQRNIVSFPRSGQHMLEKLLFDFHSKFNIHPYSYCEFYNCCQEYKCKYNSVYQKNHDFNLELNIKEDEKYVFLYRKNKIANIEAYYRYHVNNNSNYDFNDFLNFYISVSPYYENLVNKYLCNEGNNILCIDYDEFMNDPSTIFHKIIIFFGFNYEKNEIHEFINNRDEKIKKTHHLSDEYICKILNYFQ
jgi:hypothetical protein